MRERPLLVGACAVLAVASLLSITIPGALSTLGTEDPDDYQHTVEPISGNWSLGETRASPPDRSDDALRVLRYEELSTEAQDLFDRTLDGDGPPNGTRTYTPTLCRSGTYFCPYRSTDDLAPELSYDRSDDEADAAVVVLSDDGNYLFATPAYEASYHDGWMLPLGFLKALLVLPYVGFLVWTLTRERTPFVYALAIANGFVLAYLVLGHTYVVAHTGLQAAVLRRWILAIVCAWGGPLAIGSVAVSASDPPGSDDEADPHRRD